MVKNILKILTGIGNNELNDFLKKDKEFSVLSKDIFYKEGILEFLEKNEKVDIIILYEKLSGEINLIDLIKNIKIKNNEINIFIILENKDEEFESLIKKENIKNIFYNSQINKNELILKIKNSKINILENLKNENNLLKNLIKEKDETILNLQNNKINNNILINKKIIYFIGEKNSGKTLIINNIKEINKKNIFFEFKEIDINNLFELNNKNIENIKIIFIIENELEKIKKLKIIINNFILNENINLKNINIILNKNNKYSINKNIIKYFFKIKIIGKIKLNNYPDYILNKNNNLKLENIKLKLEYLKIIKKLY